MNYNIKLISEVSTAQSKRFYNNKQTLRPTINKDGQLNVIKTEVNKDKLTYHEVTLSSGTINQLKHGVYLNSFCYGKKLYLNPEYLYKFDEVVLTIKDLDKIPQLTWAFYGKKQLNKNNPYIAFKYKLNGVPVIMVQQLYEEDIKLKIISSDIDLILYLDELKNINGSNNESYRKFKTSRELNDFKEVTRTNTNYNELIYEDIEEKTVIRNGEKVELSYSIDYDNYQYEVEDSPLNIVNNKKAIQKKNNLLKAIKRLDEQIKISNEKIGDIGEVVDLIINDEFYNYIKNNYTNNGRALYNDINRIMQRFNSIPLTSDKIFKVYNHVKVNELENKKNGINKELNKLNVEA